MSRPYSGHIEHRRSAGRNRAKWTVLQTQNNVGYEPLARRFVIQHATLCSAVGTPRAEEIRSLGKGERVFSSLVGFILVRSLYLLSANLFVFGSCVVECGMCEMHWHRESMNR